MLCTVVKTVGFYSKPQGLLVVFVPCGESRLLMRWLRICFSSLPFPSLPLTSPHSSAPPSFFRRARAINKLVALQMLVSDNLNTELPRTLQCYSILACTDNMADNKGHPRELLHIKVLLICRRYQECISACLDVLKSHKQGDVKYLFSEFFATFYLACAHDEMARSMHQHSTFKTIVFGRAEQHYLQAIECLPIIEQCRTMLEEASADASTTTGESFLAHLFVPPIEFQPTNAGAVRRNVVEKDDFELESDSDSDELPEKDLPRASMPSGKLPRDFSSMSLLDLQPKLSKSVSQGLLRPIRPGSPPKAYHLPPKLPYIGKNHSRKPSPFALHLASLKEVSSPPTVTITPVKEKRAFNLTRLAEHLAAMDTQIKTHITLLQQATLATTIAQAERASRLTASSQSPVTRVPHSKSFWSFTPVDVKAADRQKKIEEGRARGWERPRYRSERYQELADKAEQEL
jgi:hypothetical protein